MHCCAIHQGAALLDGDWKLVYTSNSELLAVLALSRLPFVTIGDITQRVETLSNTVENKVGRCCPCHAELQCQGYRVACANCIQCWCVICVSLRLLMLMSQVQISVPLTRTSLATTASFEVRSPKRLQVKFEKGTIKTPQLLADVEIPSSISVMGQVLDLGQVKSLLTPLSDTLNGVISQVCFHATTALSWCCWCYALGEQQASRSRDRYQLSVQAKLEHDMKCCCQRPSLLFAGGQFDWTGPRPVIPTANRC